ncbi:MAG: Panacea domain-containing protein [Candidatus Binatus sp.]
MTYEFPDMHPDERLRELILYIAEKCADDPAFNATKLNKILFYSDFVSYSKTGTPITGAAYKALEHGPAPKRLVPVRNSMIDAGELDIKKIPKFAYSRHQYVALRRSNLDKFFRPSDIALVDELIQMFWGKSAQVVSEFSHHRLWKIARGANNNEGLIPYEAMFISDDPPTEADATRAKELAAIHGWQVD